MQGPEDDAGLAGKVAVISGGGALVTAALQQFRSPAPAHDLSDEHMVDLVLTIAFYCGVVRVLATMKIDNEPYYKEVLQQYPIPGVK
ncbi:hypothetical protein [Bradyrhizobium diazoefficiens]|uniref:hypothetical protein n=1 Tax=Bradyrhizobium diazoefficiens TaxID=1355477 RepID=UPI001FEF9FBD|nr:hypothetical protein [Bradyrhizobium diazoefficiens]